jgi:hypothetical protein
MRYNLAYLKNVYIAAYIPKIKPLVPSRKFFFRRYHFTKAAKGFNNRVFNPTVSALLALPSAYQVVYLFNLS